MTATLIEPQVRYPDSSDYADAGSKGARQRYFVQDYLFELTDVSTSGAPFPYGLPSSPPALGASLDRRIVPLSPSPYPIVGESADAAEKNSEKILQLDRATKFLDEIYALATVGDDEGATDLLFDNLDRMLCDGKFSECDSILRRVDVAKLPTTLMRSILTITAAAKSKLLSRDALYQRIERKMVELKGREKATRIIGRLA